MLIELARGIGKQLGCWRSAKCGRCGGCVDSEVGQAVRTRFPPAASQERTLGSGRNHRPQSKPTNPVRFTPERELVRARAIASIVSVQNHYNLRDKSSDRLMSSVPGAPALLRYLLATRSRYC